MLTGDLVRARVVKDTLRPGFVDVGSDRLLERCEALSAAFADALEAGLTRGELDEALREIEGDDTDVKVTRGLAKLLADRSEFAVVSPLDPIELRDKVFRRAAAGPPLSRHRGPAGRRVAEDVFAEVATELGCTARDVSRALYADLKEQQVLTEHRPLAPTALLQRYNVALVQALLLRALGLKVTLVEADPKRVRQLFRWLKFWQLMFRVRQDGDVLVIELDGPESLLRQSTRYGMQLAAFFPAVLLNPGRWRVEATVVWGGRKLEKRVEVDSTQGLVSHYQDTGAWRSNAEKWFEERFGQLDSGWTLGPGEPLALGGQAVLVPDFTLRKDGRTAHLDIVGYWRRGYLEKRLSQTPPDVVLAVSKRLTGDKVALPATLRTQVVEFAEIINAREVLARIEAVAR